MQYSINLLFLIAIIISAVSCGDNTINDKEQKSYQNDTVNKIINDTIVAKEQKFDVPIGETVSGFHYNSKGHLTYNGIEFKPAVKANKVNVPKFTISMLLPQRMAGAIAVDLDGQNFLFFLDLKNNTATPMQPVNSWNAAQEIYWSPSKRFMLAHCAYEGENFVSINTMTKKIVIMENLKPGKNFETLWMVDSEPKWLSNKDVLTFEVAEHCNPYEMNCDESGDTTTVRHKVRLDAETLKINKE